MEITKKLQVEIASVVESMLTMKEEVKSIGKAYWSTNANTLVGALGSTDAATLSTKLTKTEYLAGITLCEDLEDFFTNDAVTTTGYQASCMLLKYGSHATGTKLSEATEDIGTRMKQVGVDCLELFKKCRNILEMYANNEVGDMIANLDTQRMIPGSEMTKDVLSSGVTLVEQFKKLINNEAVTTGDYSATLAKWQSLL